MSGTKTTPEKTVFQAIQEQYKIAEIASQLGISLNRNRADSIAPDGGGKNAFNISPDSNRWYDFKLGYGGDVTDLVAYVKYNGDKMAAIKELAPKEFREKLDKIIKAEKQEQDYINSCFEVLQKQELEMARNALNYLHSRRITDETIKNFKIGFDLNSNRVVIPFLNSTGTQVRYHTARSLDQNAELRYKDATTNEFCKKCAFGLNSLKDDNLLFITEGIFDALTLIQAGYSALCKCGSGSHAITNEILNICKDYEKIILAFDRDSTGEKYNREFAKSLFERRINFEVIELPDGVKDINEYFCKDGIIQDLIDNTIEGLEYLATSFLPTAGKITKKNERDLRSNLKSFLITAMRNGADNADISTLCNILTQKGVEKNFLDAVIKKAENGESENEIVEKLIERYTLLFHEKTGFYEYLSSGVWQSQTDTTIGVYVRDYLGHTAKTRKINAIVSHMSIAVNSNAPIKEFNKKSLFVFQNGTFDVNSGKLLDHSELDYSTVLLDYDFDEKAECPTWLQFIADVTNGNEDRAKVLQEFAGYVFCPDNRFAKILVLKGEGRNGKNVFADTLRFVFGVENCTSVKASKLGDNFQAIGLKDSLLNISSENQGSLRGAEDMLKAISSGDSITDSYKGKDNIQFVPRSKLILLMNKYPYTDDDSDGFFDRLLFVNFVVKFVDNPQGEFQKKIDRRLTEKLKTERAGIFNWCYKGVKRLLKQGYFTVIDDQQANIKQFKALINDIYDFVDEYLEGYFFDASDGLGNKIARGEIYRKYEAWTKTNGLLPKSSKKFFADLRKALHEKGLTPAEYATHKNGKFERFFDFGGHKIEVSQPKPDNN